MMRTRTLILALAMLPLGTFPALATSCRLKDLAQKLAALPDFLVLKKAEKSRDALNRALGCELPPATLPSLASGQKIDPGLMIGKNILSAKGENLGVIKDVVVNRDNLKVDSVIKLEPHLGAAEVAVPVSDIDSNRGGFSLASGGSTSLATAAPYYSDKSVRHRVSINMVILGCIAASTGPDEDLSGLSEPTGATFFAHNKAYGSTRRSRVY